MWSNIPRVVGVGLFLSWGNNIEPKTLHGPEGQFYVQENAEQKGESLARTQSKCTLGWALQTYKCKNIGIMATFLEA